MMGGSGQAQLLGAGTTVLVVIAILVMRNRRPRRLRVDLLWIRPLVVCAAMTLSLVAAPPPFTLLSIALIVVALGLGAALGWQRGRMMRIEVNSATQELSAQASPMGIAFILAFVILRTVLRVAPSKPFLPGGFPVLALPSALLALGVGMMSLQGLEMWLRAQRLLTGARAADRAAPEPGTDRQSTT